MLNKIKNLIFNKEHTSTHDIYEILFFRLKNKHFYKEISNIIKTNWNCTLDKNSLIKFALFCKDSLYLWKTFHPENWLILISCLIEEKKTADAEIMLKRLIGFNGIQNCPIEHYLLVSSFAESINIITPAIEKSAYYCHEFYKKEKSDDLKKYLKGKSIAVVGGSPCEIGKNKGQEIDLHDIVIRFNNYPQEEKYHCDYGKKTNIWVRQSSKDTVNKKDLSIYDYVIWADDFTSFKIGSKEILNVIGDYFEKYNEKLSAIEKNYYYNLRKESGILRPTSGAIILYYLKEVLGDFKNVDAYGFAFLSNDINDDKHFFDKLCKISKIHDFFQETPFLYDFYYNNKR